MIDKELYQKVLEKAIAEAVHPSEIETRAMIYYRAAVIGLGLGPATKRTDAASQPTSQEQK